MKKNNIYYNYYPAQYAFHLAAIIPVSGQPLDFNLPWSDCLMPISKNYLAVERAIVEALYAGADTIWIIANEDINPVLRKRIGEVVYPPNQASFRIGQVPIFYVSSNPKDYDVRNSLSWDILYAAKTCYKIYKNLSKWVTPTKFLVTFPFGVYPPEVINKYKKKIFQPNNFYLSYKGETVKDNKYIAFTFGFDEIEKYTKFIKENELLGTKNEKFVPAKERFSGRFFTLQDVFSISPIDEKNDEIEEIPWYYNIDNWEDYFVYLASSERKELKIPPDGMFTKLKWYGMGMNEEEVNEQK